MHGRGFRVALLVFETVWLLVVVPGHPRGIVPLPGERCAVCRKSTSPCCHDQRGSPDRGRVPADPAAHCAICYFTARLSPPPAIDPSPPPPQLLCSAESPAAPLAPALPLLPTYDTRGPPDA